MNPSKLSKTDAKRLDDAKSAVSDARDTYINARQDFDAAYTAALAELSSADLEEPTAHTARPVADAIMESYNDVLRPAWDDVQTACDALRELCEEFATDLRAAWEEKSERWQESEKGSDSSDWIDTFEGWETPEDLAAVTAQELVDAAVSHGWADVADVFEHDFESACDTAEELRASIDE